MKYKEGDYVLLKKIEDLKDYSKMSEDVYEKLKNICGTIVKIRRSLKDSYLIEEYRHLVIFDDDILCKIDGNKIVRE